jgi:transitional endoplasmic reticulum ATPase
MPTRTALVTQQRLQNQALQQLAVIGGQLTNDDDIRFEGNAFVFPEKYAGNLEGLANDVVRYVRGQQEEVLVDRTFDYRPYDGAYATFHCLKQYFGYAQSKAKQGAFGPQPPHEISIPLGYVKGDLITQTVPWGDMVLPGLPGSTLALSTARSPKGDLFRLTARCRKADKAYVDGFFRVVQKFLEENSIYRGKCFNGDMVFFDTDKIDPSQFVYSEKVWAQAEVNILSPLRDAHVIAAEGLSAKRVTLLEGPFGTGKSGLGRTAAKIAVENNVTAIMCTPGQDDPLELIRTALLYLPALVFIEDIDIIAAQRDPQVVTRILDVFDGPTMKNIPITVVMTTNHVENIHKGMMRSGRIDGVMHIGAMDRAGVEKLAHIVIGSKLEDGIDFDAVFDATYGFMPAYVKEGLERAVRHTIARTGKGGQPINGEDLIHAMDSLRDQYDLQEKASDHVEQLPPLDRMFREMIRDNAEIPTDVLENLLSDQLNNKLDGAKLIDTDYDKEVGTLFVADS